MHNLNLLKNNGIFHKAAYNYVMIGHCIYLGVTGYIYIFLMLYFSLNINFVLANSIDPGEMAHCAAFHLGIH